MRNLGDARNGLTVFGRGEWLVCSVVAVLSILVVFHAMLLAGYRAGPGGTDSRFLNYVLEHYWGWLSGDRLHASFWDMPFFFPTKNVATYSDLLVSYEWLYAPWRLLGLPYDTAFVAWLYGLAFVNYLAAYSLLRAALGFGMAGSLAGAFVMVFAQSHVQHGDHLQLFPFFYVIGMLTAAVRYVSLWLEERETPGTKRLKWISVMAGCAVCQLYGSYYLLYFFVLLLGIACLAAMCRARSRRLLWAMLARDWRVFAINAVVAVLLVLPVARHFLATFHIVGPRDWNLVKVLLPRPASWLYNHFAYVSAWMSSVAPWNSLPGGTERWEHSFGLGLVTSLVTVWVLVALRKKALFGLLLSVTAALLLLTTLFAGEYSLWYYLWKHAPGASALRAVGRVGLFLSVPAGIALAALVSADRGRALRAGALLVAGLCIAEQIVPVYTYDLDVCRAEIAGLASRVDPDKKAFALVGSDTATRDRTDPVRLQLNAMFASNLTGVPTINGYSGNFPPHWTEAMNAIGPQPPETARVCDDDYGSWLRTWAMPARDVQFLVLEELPVIRLRSNPARTPLPW